MSDENAAWTLLARLMGDDARLASTAECVCRHGAIWIDCDDGCAEVLIATALRSAREDAEVRAEARVREVENLLREALPDTMGGYPDLFYPSGGWDAWEERALRALASASPAPKCGAERVSAERVAYACRLPAGHEGDHHPNPCGHDGCTGLECLAASPERPNPTHRCNVCGALWTLNPPHDTTLWYTWSLWSKSCGPCCDNAVMGDQIEPITEFHRLCDPGPMGEPASPAPSAKPDAPCPKCLDPECNYLRHGYCKRFGYDAPSAPAEGGKEK